MQNDALVAALNRKMPFGKYAGQPLFYLPERYLIWFQNRGFPPGLLGEQLSMIYEIKLNGLEELVKPLVKARNTD